MKSGTDTSDRTPVDHALGALPRVRLVPGEQPRLTLYEVARIATEGLRVERFGVWCATQDRSAIRLYYLSSRHRWSG